MTEIEDTRGCAATQQGVHERKLDQRGEDEGDAERNPDLHATRQPDLATNATVDRGHFLWERVGKAFPHLSEKNFFSILIHAADSKNDYRSMYSVPTPLYRAFPHLFFLANDLCRYLIDEIVQIDYSRFF